MNPHMQNSASSAPNNKPDSRESLQSALSEAIETYGKNSPEAADCLYQLGLYALHNGDFMGASNTLGDALYIRRMYYEESSMKIQEIMYALQLTTVM